MFIGMAQTSMMTGCKPERQEWVDMAKGIAIIAVVMGHIGFCWPHSRFLPLNVLLIWLWHVPVFFMIGGFFLDDKKLVHPVAFIKRKLKTLYLPLLYVYVPVLLLHNVFISTGVYDVGTNYSGHHVSWWGATDYVVQGIKSLLLVGQEPLLGAMWFVFVLFWAQTLLSVSSNLLRKTGRQWEQNAFDLVRFLVLLCLAVLSWSLTAMGYTKMLFSVTLVAAWLIYVGMLLMRRLRPQFDNGIVALICVVIAWHASCSVGGVNLVENRFHDVITLTVSALMLKFLQSFLPFIMGMDNNMMEYAKNNYIEKQNNITIIYLKKNKKSYIDVENPDENANIEIPSELKDMLANDLKTILKNFSYDNVKEDNILSKLSRFANNTSQFSNLNKHQRDEQIGKQLRQVFLKFFVEIFGDYQEYTSSIDDTAYFNSESFLNNIPKEQQNFYISIFNSEMFHDFLQRNVVVNSSLYKPDRYYNKYCIREKKNTVKRTFKRKKTFLNNENFYITSKDLTENITRKKLNTRNVISSTKIININSRLNNIDNNKNLNINNNSSNSNTNEFINESSLNYKKNTESSDSDSEDKETASLNSSFNEETLKICLTYKFSNKYIIPPCFLKVEKFKKDICIEDIEELILNHFGQDMLIKKNEYENKYIFDRLPIIDYKSISKIKDKALKEKRLDEFDCINRYLLPPEIIRDNLRRPKRQRSYTLVKSLAKDNRLDPKIIQLEDFMKEILSSSGKNASNILYPKGAKEINIKDEENIKNGEPEKENGGSKDIVINGKINRNIGKLNNFDYLKMIEFQNIVIRRHFALIIFQNKVNVYQSNIISSNSYNILSKMIFNVFLYSGNKSVEDFQVCRALTKSLYLYYKKNNKGKKVYLFHAFNKAKPFDIWNDKLFWQYFYEREMENQNEQNDSNKFNVLIEIASIMNDLHFPANTQVDIISDYIAKKEISDKDLQNTLLKTIVKQINNRVVMSATMDL